MWAKKNRIDLKEFHVIILVFIIFEKEKIFIS